MIQKSVKIEKHIYRLSNNSMKVHVSFQGKLISVYSRRRMFHDSVVIGLVLLNLGDGLLIHVDEEDALVSRPLLLILHR